MRIPRFLTIVSVALSLAMLISACDQFEGSRGPRGLTGDTGATGATGATGDTGEAGTSVGTVSGTITDSLDAAVAGATIATSPSSVTATSDATGAYTLTDVPVGVYTVSASLSGYNTGSSDVSVGAGQSATADFQLSLAAGALTSLSGHVENTAGTDLAGATVTLTGTSLSATTDANGDYTITSVPVPGPYFIDVTAPAGYLDGGTRDAVWISNSTTTVDDIKLSAQPPATATYIGKITCAICHPEQGGEHKGSAHWRSLTQDTSRMIELQLWPAVGTTIDTGETGLDPADGVGTVSVYWCQNTAGAYAMKFGGTADCTVADGTLVPVSGTYGGEGDGGIDDTPNVGVFKQRFFAKLADVPAAAAWSYTAGKDKDYLIMPVQVTQSGDSAPTYGGYHGGDWATQGRAFSKKCAGCHNTGMDIAWDDTTEFITAYDYIDFNISCERCHGPGSAHASSGGGLSNQIINPEYLGPEAERQVCGQCHAADEGHSAAPDGFFGYAWNSDHAGDVGGGVYVPGVYDLFDFIGNLDTDGFHAWPDGQHGKAHRQQYSELALSIHTNNPYDRLTCTSCHKAHSLMQGPEHRDEYVFEDGLQLRNNEVCLSCHATHGPFADLGKDDVAAIHDGTVTKDGVAMSFSTNEVAAAEDAIAKAVVDHMNDEANMGKFVVYDPANEPGVGRCSNCHMPRTAKSGGYLTGLDAFGNSALIEGDQNSHRFDIVAPQVSKTMAATAASDTDVMPNSCGKCHERYRYSAD